MFLTIWHSGKGQTTETIKKNQWTKTRTQQQKWQEICKKIGGEHHVAQ
jgi:hypothetical protein